VERMLLARLLASAPVATPPQFVMAGLEEGLEEGELRIAAAASPLFDRGLELALRAHSVVLSLQALVLPRTRGMRGQSHWSFLL